MTDLEIVREIEKELDIKLEHKVRMNYTDNYFTLDLSGRVKDLNLSHCEIKNLFRISVFLTSFNNLTELDLGYNQISDINGLKSLTCLKELDLDGNQISDTDALKGFTSLMKLNLSFNQIIDINGLNGLICLKELYLSRESYR